MSIVLVCMPIFMFARFGKYGIEEQESFEGYQQYVGQIVKYIKGGNANGTDYDIKNFVAAGGNYDKEYRILKITGNKDKVTFLLQEVNGKNKVKLTAKNQYSYYSIHPRSRISDIPLLLVEKVNSDKQRLMEKAISSVCVTDIQLERKGNGGYPEIMYVITDKSDNSTYYSNAENVNDLDDLGRTFTNPKFKCHYTIVNVFIDEKERYLEDWKKHYLLKNSLDGRIEDYVAKFVNSNPQCVFEEKAGAGQFYAILKEVEKPSNPSVRYGNTTTITDKEVTKFSYIDNYIDILIFAGNKQFYFTLKNISDNSIKVIWDEAVFVDVDGSSSKIMHSGTKYSQRDGEQPPSTIIKEAKLDDMVVPTGKVYYDDTFKSWESKSLYESADKTKEGQYLQLMLPIQVKDVINEYVFKFALTYKYQHPESLAD